MWLRNVQQATEGSVVMMSKLGMRHVSRQKRGGGGGVFMRVFLRRGNVIRQREKKERKMTLCNFVSEMRRTELLRTLFISLIIISIVIIIIIVMMRMILIMMVIMM